MNPLSEWNIMLGKHIGDEDNQGSSNRNPSVLPKYTLGAGISKRGANNIVLFKDTMTRYSTLHWFLLLNLNTHMVIGYIKIMIQSTLVDGHNGTLQIQILIGGPLLLRALT